MEKQPRQLTLLHVPEPPHRDARLLTRQLQQQEADYHVGLRDYMNNEKAKEFQLPLLPQDSNEAQPELSDERQTSARACLAQVLAGLFSTELA